MQTFIEQSLPVTYRVADAAAAIGISRRTVERWIIDGKLRSKKVGRTVLIPAEDIRALVLGGE